MMKMIWRETNTQTYFFHGVNVKIDALQNKRCFWSVLHLHFLKTYPSIFRPKRIWMLGLYDGWCFRYQDLGIEKQYYSTQKYLSS